MKVLVAVSCLLAVASAGYLGPHHLAVIGPQGVPLEPAENVAARAAHAAAHVAAGGYPHALTYAPALAYAAIPQVPQDTPEVAAAKAEHFAAHAAAGHPLYQYVPSIYAYAPALIHGAVPQETPEVAAARAAHLAAHAAATHGAVIVPIEEDGSYLGEQAYSSDDGQYRQAK